MKIQHFMALVVLSLATVPGARAAVLAGPITNAVNGHRYYPLSDTTWTASEAEARGLGGQAKSDFLIQGILWHASLRGWKTPNVPSPAFVVQGRQPSRGTSTAHS